MDNWQKSHITENLPSLIEHIECNAFLLSHLNQFGSLAEVDIQKLEAIGNFGGKIEKAAGLLGILVTRRGGYKDLAKALYNCKQSGALITLLYGIQANVTNENPFKFCGIEVNTNDILSKDVIFEGAKIPLKDICKSINAVQLQNIIAENFDVSMYNQLLLDQPITVATETIPDALTYYIPRTLSISTHLDPKIFQDLQDDIHCIEGSELNKLSRLASAKGLEGRIKISPGRGKVDLPDRSTNQLDRLSARIILLEHPDHFDAISASTSKSVHWIKEDHKNYFHVKSSNGRAIKGVIPYINSNHWQTFTEDEFVQKCLAASGNSPILLYDSPGMGKSVLMTQLARHLKDRMPTSNVIYFQFSQLITHLCSKKRTICSDAVKQAILEMITTNKLGRCIAENLLDNNGHHVYFFLDGYDEINEDDAELARCILDCVYKDLKNFHMFIATRPHRRHELEMKFGILGYNILPFSDNNKLTFFTNYWQNVHQVVITEQIKFYAEHCLQSLKYTMSEGESDIAGIPLQCQMLADIFAGDAKRGGLLSTESSRFQLDSIYNVYKQYMQTKFANSSSDAEERQYLYDFHVQQAIQTLFYERCPGLLGDFSGLNDYEIIYRIGILQPSKSDQFVASFVHSTLAEFLAAEYLVTCVTVRDDVKANLLVGLWFGQALCTLDTHYEEVYKILRHSRFQHPGVVNFINNFINNMPSLRECSEIFKLAVQKSEFYISAVLLNLIHASVAANVQHLCAYILHLYLDLDDDIPEDGNWSNKDAKTQRLVDDLVDDAMTVPRSLVLTVDIAAKYSSFELVKLACALVRCITGKEFDYFRKYTFFPILGHPVLDSVERGHYKIFEYLVNFNRNRFYRLPLLHHCLQNSWRDSGAVIADKVEIVKMILHEESELLERKHSIEHTDHHHVPLLTHGAHFELIKCLIEAGADCTETNKLRRNIAHLATNYFSVEEYHQFVTLVVATNNSEIFKRYDLDLCTPIHMAVFGIDLKTETLELFANHCHTDFNDYFGNLEPSLLLRLAEKGA